MTAFTLNARDRGVASSKGRIFPFLARGLSAAAKEAFPELRRSRVHDAGTLTIEGACPNRYGSSDISFMNSDSGQALGAQRAAPLRKS